MQTDALQYVHRHFLMVLFTAFCLLMAVRTTHAQQLPESDVYDNDRYETVESEDEREEEKMDDPTERIAFDLMRYADPLTGVIPDGIRSRELLFSSSLPTRTSLIESRAEKGSRIQSLPVTWHDRGPNNQGGRTRALGIDRDNESNIIAGGVSGGVWRSTDTGMTWTRVNDIDKSHSITCLVQDPRPGSRNVWYYGTGEQRANSANLPGDGIYRSTDNGLSWSLLPATSRNTPQSRDQMFDYVHRIVVNPANLEQDEVYAACYGGIARSLDGGESWQEVLGSFSNRAFYAEIAVTSTGIFYATISSDGQKTEGIWRSEDGEEWVDITPQDFPSNFQRIVIGIAPSNEDIVYFFAHTPNVGVNSTSLWVYNHNGGKGGIWEDRSSSLPAKVETYDSYCMSVAVRPDNPDVVYLGNITIYRSTNGFRDGSEVSTQLSGGQHADQHELLMFPSDPDRLLSGHDGGISYADNGLENKISWSFRNRGYTTTQYYSVAVDPVTAGSTLMIGGAQDNGSWLFDGEEIGGDGRKIFGSDGGYCAITDSAKDFYTSYQKGAIYHSQYNDSGSRIGYARVDPDGGESYLFIHPFTLDPNNQNIMYLPEG